MEPTDTLARAAASVPEFHLVVLFGSAARGRLRPDSDLDVAVSLRPDSAEARLRAEAVLSAACDRPLDFVVIDDAPPQLRFEIAKGKLIFARTPAAWRDMKAAAMIDWWDWEPTARWVHGQYLSRLRARVGGADGP